VVGVESNLAPLRFRLGWGIEDVHDALENLHDGRFVEVETAFEFLLQLRQLARHRSAVGEHRPHLYEGPHGKDAHLHGLRTVQDVGGHDGPVLGEGVGQDARIAVFL